VDRGAFAAVATGFVPRITRMTLLSWGPRRGRAATYAAAGLALGVLAFRTEGGPVGLDGGLPLTVVAVLLEVLAALDVWSGTALTADENGLLLSRGATRREFLPWSAIEEITATSERSRGLLQLASLEIDLGERLIVISRHRLGSSPETVAAVLRSVRPSEPPQ
jgi:hypothetical protein